MGSWTARTTVEGSPEQILEALTDPGACARWSPIDFQLEEIDGDRLAAGSRARVAGSLAGRELIFELEVLQSDDRRFALRASGPVVMDVEYLVEDICGGCGFAELEASIEVRPSGGLRAQVLSRATDVLLAGGALRTAVSRIGQEVSTNGQTLTV